MKKCFKCGVEKPLFDFYKHKQMADGHLNKCKTCTRNDVHQHRHGAGRETVLAYDRQRAKTPERMSHNREVTQRWRDGHPKERAAQVAVGHAIRDGRLFKWPVCAVPECDSTRPVAHHPDYDQPLSVVWLCQAHHKQAHEIKPQEPTQAEN